MKYKTILPDRIQRLNVRTVKKGEYVLYWMQQSQRAEDNPALEFAVSQANALKYPVLVVFGLSETYPQANLRHYFFMLEGLKETGRQLSQRGIQFLVQKGEPDNVALLLSKRAAMVVCDCGYLRHQKAWRSKVAQKADCAVVQIEGDVIVPVALASDKPEYAARTIRPKIHRMLESHLQPHRVEAVRFARNDLAESNLDLSGTIRLCNALQVDRSIKPVTSFFKGGTSEGKQKFNRFLNEKCQFYAKNSNQPQTDDTSQISPYLHFGQISTLYLALKVSQTDHLPPEGKDAFLEQLIVRRELAMNYVNYHPHYDRYEGLPAWARQTLRDHTMDERPVLYDLDFLENGKTHDIYWNAAMQEMRVSGYMHNYMRMYWGKKILQWSKTPRVAFDTILHLNNKYFLDGRDPNSFTSVGWIFGLHDRPWKERNIFGKVRYMAASGLERKCNIMAYVAKVQKLMQT